MDDKNREEQPEKPDGAEVPPDTSEHPSHEEQVGGKGAEDPDKMADEDRYRKGPGW
jgi:hypothetical protein